MEFHLGFLLSVIFPSMEIVEIKKPQQLPRFLNLSIRIDYCLTIF